MMDLDFSEFFKQYEQIVAQADAAFKTVAQAHPDCIACKPGCSDCCYALFDLSLVEALYLNSNFLEKLDNTAREKILAKADRADRKAYQIKREAFQAVAKGKETEQVMARVAWERVRCPLLNEADRCDLYSNRPVTCRIYGIPTAIDGKGHTCGQSGFAQGAAYPTVNLDAINQRLADLSHKLVERLNTRHTEMGDMLMPVSMALLTKFDREYLGIKEKDACQVKAIEITPKDKS
ncbi:MAG: YkgJ family cysteine cluster protein [Desulfatibacillaceae bacterium]|nr:YkgJ family cysteine cluster protein [Desulfatibacillaceae bacterium]